MDDHTLHIIEIEMLESACELDDMIEAGEAEGGRADALRIAIEIRAVVLQAYAEAE